MESENTSIVPLVVVALVWFVVPAVLAVINVEKGKPWFAFFGTSSSARWL